jgi:hypothetical protein
MMEIVLAREILQRIPVMRMPSYQFNGRVQRLAERTPRNIPHYFARRHKDRVSDRIISAEDMTWRHNQFGG